MDAANAKAEAAKAELRTYGGTGTKPGSNGGGSHSGGHNGSGGNTPKEEAAKGSLADLEQQLSDLQKKYKEGLIKITPDDYKAKVAALEKQIQQKKIELGLVVDIPEGSIKKIDEQIAQKTSELKLAIDDESRARIQREIDELVGQKEVIELRLKPVI